MASNIETQILSQLSATEGAVSAARAVGRISRDSGPDTVEDLAYLSNFLGELVFQNFQILRRQVVEDVLPLVADVKAVRLA
ncbi:hypothetical protein [Herminiimonas arsenitoxidans]|uniref:hypothetical protein n=1 Tax=Herminiimonas arsenitoxidans TaxID=1809410 RepID=UPI0009703FF0|nr:hypothetical protein [Herminiimonas arsenitoxidans]